MTPAADDMATAYTPGLQVTEWTRYRARRLLPINGDVLVETGEQVESQQIVARTDLPGDVVPINLANQLSLLPADVPGCMLMKQGDRVEPGDVLAITKGIFGLFRTPYVARTGGTIETISEVTGQVILRGESIPVQRRAYVTGTVVEVIPHQGVIVEAEVALIQGIFGIGGESFGPIRLACKSPDQRLNADQITDDMSGCIIVGGSKMTGDTVRAAIEVGAAAVISGGIDDADLKDILGYDLGVAITGTENIGTTVIITEGFGEIAMAERTFELLRTREGADASVNGATQIRAGVMRPEIVIPVDSPDNRPPLEVIEGDFTGSLQNGITVRIIRDPYFGQIGTVSALPSEPQVLGSGSKARVLEVKCSSGDTLIVPRANVEIVGG